jgi:2-polyprenyl-3-methyl-5-hydroxy-6-metoxy-1,4-benzoquinol methylase
MSKSQNNPSRCWLCGSEHVVAFKARSLSERVTPEDLRITDLHYGRTLALLTCAECSFIFADGDELADLTALYEALEDPQYEETQDSRVLQMKWILSLVLKIRPDAHSLLDIGAGTGLLVAEAARAGMDAVGIEPSHNLSNVAVRHGRGVIQGVFPNATLKGRRFDVVCLVDVIEHVANPLKLLRDCREAMLPGGVLILVTPDVGSIVARIMRGRWWHFRVAHVGYFNRRSLMAALRSCGLTVQLEYRAKWFFRVRYLTERLERYLPFIKFINRFAMRWSAFNRLYSRVVTINLRDSFLLIASTD